MRFDRIRTLKDSFPEVTKEKYPPNGEYFSLVSSASQTWNTLYPDLISLSEKLGELGIEEYFDV